MFHYEGHMLWSCELNSRCIKIFRHFTCSLEHISKTFFEIFKILVFLNTYESQGHQLCFRLLYLLWSFAHTNYDYIMCYGWFSSCEKPFIWMHYLWKKIFQKVIFFSNWGKLILLTWGKLILVNTCYFIINFSSQCKVKTLITYIISIIWKVCWNNLKHNKTYFNWLFEV